MDPNFIMPDTSVPPPSTTAAGFPQAPFMIASMTNQRVVMYPGYPYAMPMQMPLQMPMQMAMPMPMPMHPMPMPPPRMSAAPSMPMQQWHGSQPLLTWPVAPWLQQQNNQGQGPTHHPQAAAALPWHNSQSSGRVIAVTEISESEPLEVERGREPVPANQDEVADGEEEPTQTQSQRRKSVRQATAVAEAGRVGEKKIPRAQQAPPEPPATNTAARPLRAATRRATARPEPAPKGEGATAGPSSSAGGPSKGAEGARARPAAGPSKIRARATKPTSSVKRSQIHLGNIQDLKKKNPKLCLADRQSKKERKVPDRAAAEQLAQVYPPKKASHKERKFIDDDDDEEEELEEEEEDMDDPSNVDSESDKSDDNGAEPAGAPTGLANVTFSAAESEVIVISDDDNDKLKDPAAEGSSPNDHDLDDEYWDKFFDPYYPPMSPELPAETETEPKQLPPEEREFDCCVCHEFLYLGDFRGILLNCKHDSYCYRCAMQLFVNFMPCAICRGLIIAVNSELVG